MTQCPIREYSGKRLIQNWMNQNDVPKEYNNIQQMVFIGPETDLNAIESPFTRDQLLVSKPDQLVKRRGKLGLVHLKKNFAQSLSWVASQRGRELQIGNAKDTLRYFLIEPFVAHSEQEEMYICIHSVREGDEILFYHQGGVDVGDVDAKASRLVLPCTEEARPVEELSALFVKDLLQGLQDDRKRAFVARFICYLHRLYTDLHFAYMEINPLVVRDDLSEIHVLDLAAKLDSAAEFQCHNAWHGVVDFPPYFGHQSSMEEKHIADLDERTGASLKLTILNPKGRVWTMVAGGGASVIYADTICDIGFAEELGNYGEYSGAPTKALTYEYACTVIKLCLRFPHPKGKVLLIGGGIANFTDVAATFAGIIQALTENRDLLRERNTKIYVRRGGPNYQTGLKLMRKCATDCNLDMKVYGPESHITAIVSMALLDSVDDEPEYVVASTPRSGAETPEAGKKMTFPSIPEESKDESSMVDVNYEAYVAGLDLSGFKWNLKWEHEEEKNQAGKPPYVMTENTRAIVYGMQVRAVQNMMDFDYISNRSKHSVAAIVYSFAAGSHYRQFYWGSRQVMVPVYKSLEEALQKFPDVNTVVNFASSRSAYRATLDMLKCPQIRHITIIAEGVPERCTKHLINLAYQKDVVVLGPSTVGGLKPGCFRIGNTGGMLDNIVACRLHRPGSVAFVSRSGGLSNELSNIISRLTDGVLEGMAIGGDRFPATTFVDHLIRYQRDPRCKIMILLGEVGGTLEYDVIKAIEDGRLTKPIIAWCTGTCAKQFKHEVQFGHAGAMAQSQMETAWAKNAALAKAGCFVPESFDDFGRMLKFLYKRMVSEGIISPGDEVEPPPVPIDYKWAQKMGMVRKPSSFLSGISDERGDELVYAGMPISEIFKQELGVGGVVGLLWFRRRLPDFCNQFIEMVLMITADHGPAVSGAHNTIVTARAGKDLISSLCSGLLTIGPRFGGALDGAAQMFTHAYDNGWSPTQFVKETRKAGKLIMGIGHKVKSLENPDKRVEIVVEFAKKHFQETPVLDYALEVQKVTTRKKSNLILNVDGAVACAFVDLLRGCQSFTREEADEYIFMGTLNALFVLGRSIGFIGHFLDQKRLKQGLYRHPTDDITYFLQDLQ